MSQIAENVNRIIRDKGLNPDDIARMVGITVKNFRQMLDGRNAPKWGRYIRRYFSLLRKFKRN